MPNTEPIYAWLQHWLPLIKDGVTTLAALVAAYVGFTGLQTWKKQLTANAERDLARRVLVKVYKVLDAIDNCRLDGLINGDVVETKKIHEVLFEKLKKAKEELDVELLEAEAVWGGDDSYQSTFLPFQVQEDLLRYAFWEFYAEGNKGTEAKMKAYKDLFVSFDLDQQDEFSERLEDSIKELEDFLRPKLTLKPTKIKKERWWNRLRMQRKV
jgi:hypothetical protein